MKLLLPAILLDAFMCGLLYSPRLNGYAAQRSAPTAAGENGVGGSGGHSAPTERTQTYQNGPFLRTRLRATNVGRLLVLPLPVVKTVRGV